MRRKRREEKDEEEERVSRGSRGRRRRSRRSLLTAEGDVGRSVGARSELLQDNVRQS